MNPDTIRMIYKAFYSIISIQRLLHISYHHAHVNVFGASFYSDHLLLQRLYESGSSIEEIDNVMERLKGILPVTNKLSILNLLEGMTTLYWESPGLDFDNNNNLAKDIDAVVDALLKLELRLQTTIAEVIDIVEATPDMHIVSDGIINLLQDIADHHQQNIFLLRQRLN